MTRKFAVLVVGLVALLALGVVVVSAQDGNNVPCDQFFGGMMGGRGGMMQGRGGMMGSNFAEECPQQGNFGMGMMGGHMSMMFGDFEGMGFGPGTGMMMGNFEDMGQFGPGAGMMGGWQAPADLAPVGETLTLDEAIQVAEAYIAEWDSEQPLELGEVMQFDNHSYAVAEEAETGRGAFEFLIDPQSGYVVGEPGSNMMWNLKYGMEMGRGMGFNRPSIAEAEEMNVTVDEAYEYAQAYLDEALPGATVDTEEADTFYGYYTLHVLEDGEVTGMLGVNGYTGQVFLHHWHGNFISMTEHE